MGLNVVKLPSPSSVGAGQTATLDIPLGPTYHRIDLIYKESGTLAAEADLKAGINDVRVKIGGKAQRTFSAAQALEIQQFYGMKYAAGHLPIFFAEPWKRTTQGEDFLAWGTQDIPFFQIEVDIDAGATAPTLEAYAEISRTPRNLGVIKRMRRYTVPVTAIGERQFQNLPKVGTSYSALHCFEASPGDIESVLIEVDQTKVWDTPAHMASALYVDRGLVPQTGIFSVAFDFDRRVGSPLSMVKSDGSAVSDFMITTTMGSAANFTIVTEELGPRF